MRYLAITALAATLAVIAVPHASGRSGAPATVKLLRCGETGIFQGRARAIPATERMHVRMTLLQRASGGRFEPVTAPGLGVWRRSRPGSRRFVYTHEVENLRTGTDYRMAASFRWVGPAERTIRRMNRRSAICTPGGDRPNLRVRGIDITSGPRPGTASYLVAVRNSGSGAAPASTVSLVVDGTAVPTTDIAPLRSLERRIVEIPGPPCGRMVTAVVDPGGAVPESNEDDNARTVSCPPR
ncbi:MAG TPA: CARDB domain-containing protein [Thermoleophilaceae bacterium]|nr:CARDB domain-containing protein [Thermoleophilaceae bacterium]